MACFEYTRLPRVVQRRRCDDDAGVGLEVAGVCLLDRGANVRDADRKRSRAREYGDDVRARPSPISASRPAISQGWR